MREEVEPSGVNREKQGCGNRDIFLNPFLFPFFFFSQSGRMDKYSDLVAIGRGSFGVVYRAQRVAGGPPVCIKMIPVSGGRDQGVIEAENEVGIISHLDHPNVIHYVESFYHDMALCIVMEYADGGDLARVIEGAGRGKQPVPEPTVLRWLHELLGALAYIHKHGVLHRDIKPANILIRGGDVLLGDFGVSKALSPNGPSIAVTGVGTVAYMAPETMGGETRAASDVWATGCVFWELMNGQPLFRASNMVALIAKISADGDPPWDLDPQREQYYSEELILVIKWMLTKDSATRPTAAEVLQSPIFDALNRPKRETLDFGAMSSPYGDTFYRDFEKDRQEIERRMRSGSRRCEECLTKQPVSHPLRPAPLKSPKSIRVVSGLGRGERGGGSNNKEKGHKLHRVMSVIERNKVPGPRGFDDRQYSGYSARGRNDEKERSRSLNSRDGKEEEEKEKKKKFLVRKSARIDNEEIRHQNALLKKHILNPKGTSDEQKPWKARKSSAKRKEKGGINIELHVPDSPSRPSSYPLPISIPPAPIYPSEEDIVTSAAAIPGIPAITATTTSSASVSVSIPTPASEPLPGSRDRSYSPVDVKQTSSSQRAQAQEQSKKLRDMIKAKKAQAKRGGNKNQLDVEIYTTLPSDAEIE